MQMWILVICSLKCFCICNGKSVSILIKQIQVPKLYSVCLFSYTKTIKTFWAISPRKYSMLS